MGCLLEARVSVQRSAKLEKAETSTPLRDAALESETQLCSHTSLLEYKETKRPPGGLWGARTLQGIITKRVDRRPSKKGRFDQLLSRGAPTGATYPTMMQL